MTYVDSVEPRGQTLEELLDDLGLPIPNPSPTQAQRIRDSITPIFTDTLRRWGTPDGGFTDEGRVVLMLWWQYFPRGGWV